MSRISLAVLITYHNEGPLLRECLDSLLASGERPDEVFIHDDGTHEPADLFVPPGAAVRIVRGNGNRGPSYARNALAKISKSDFVHFHDADDLFLPGFTDRIRATLSSADPDLILNQVSVRSMNGSIDVARNPFHLLERDRNLLKFILGNIVSTQNGTIRRSAMLGVGGYDESLWHREDTELLIRLALSGCSYEIIPDPLILIRQRPDSHSMKALESQLHALRTVKRLSTYLPAEFSASICESAAAIAVGLCQLGAVRESEEALQLAGRLGNPRFTLLNRRHRLANRTLGVRRTESLRRSYRALKHWNQNLFRTLHRSFGNTGSAG